MPASLPSVSLDEVRRLKRRRQLGSTVAMACLLVVYFGIMLYKLPLPASVLLIVLAGVFYSRPFWIINQSIRAWLWLAGVRSAYVQLGSFRIHYLAGGRGRPLVLVHGLDGWAENWFKLMPALMRKGYRVYSIDLLGFGESACPDVNYSIQLQTDLLHQFVESQNLSCIDVGGWSMGGWVTLKFALTHPQRVRRIFVTDSLGIFLKLPFDPALFHSEDVRKTQEFLALLTPHGHLLPRFLARDVVRLLRPKRWVVQRALASMLTGEDLLDGTLGALRVPVLIAWGRQDAILPLECGEEMHRRIPQSLLAIFDGCGHLTPVEDRGRLLPEILRFLDAEPPLPASVRVIPI